MARVVGIDLGTAKSVVCVLENGRPRIIANAQGANSTPSVVGFNEDGSVIVGQKAADRAVQHPDRTATAVRPELGSGWKFTDHGQQYSAPQIAACILRKLKRDSEAQLGDEVSEVVISIPANFSEPERRATQEACTLAGLRVKRIVSETSLAAFAYNLQTHPHHENVLVFDLGAGTFSVALFEIDQGMVQTRAVGGDRTLGGRDWDRRLARLVMDRFRATTGIELSVDTQAAQRILAAAEQAKVELSSTEHATLTLPYIAKDANGNGLFLSETVSRAEFASSTTDLLDRLRTPIAAVLADAGVSMAQVDRVVLIGGAGRMPAVAALLTELNGGREPYRGMHPDETVAAGAAALLGVFDGTIRDDLLLDTIPRSIGIATGGGKFARLIERNTTIPTKRSTFITTVADNQPSVTIQISQGEHEFASSNPQLGVLHLDGLPPAPRGAPRIEIIAEVDVAGHTVVTAKHPGTGAEHTITVLGDPNPPAIPAPWLVLGEIELHPDQDTGTSREKPAGESQARAPRASAPQPDAPRASVPQSDTPRAEASQAHAARASAPQSEAPRAPAAQADSSRAFASQPSAPRAASTPPRDQPSGLITDAASRLGLGQHLSTHPHRWHGGSPAWIYGIPIAIVAAIVIASGITDGAMSAFVVALVFAGVAGLVWVRKFITSPRHTVARAKYAGSRNTGARFRDAQLSLFEQGAVVLSGGETHAFRWETVSVLQDIVRTTHKMYGNETGISMTYRYQLTDPGGASYLVTGDFTGAEQWGPTIQQRVTAAQLPRALADIDAGQNLEFGAIALSRNAVRAHNRSVSWTEVDEIRVKEGFISVRVAGEWFALAKVTVSAIPNVFVFLELAERLRAATPR